MAALTLPEPYLRNENPETPFEFKPIPINYEATHIQARLLRVLHLYWNHFGRRPSVLYTRQDPQMSLIWGVEVVVSRSCPGIVAA